MLFKHIKIVCDLQPKKTRLWIVYFLFNILTLVVVIVVVLAPYCSVSHFVTWNKIKEKFKYISKKNNSKTNIVFVFRIRTRYNSDKSIEIIIGHWLWGYETRGRPYITVGLLFFSKVQKPYVRKIPILENALRITIAFQMSLFLYISGGGFLTRDNNI